MSLRNFCLRFVYVGLLLAWALTGLLLLALSAGLIVLMFRQPRGTDIGPDIITVSSCGFLFDPYCNDGRKLWHDVWHP